MNKFCHNIQRTVTTRPTPYYTVLVKDWTFFGRPAYDRMRLAILMVIPGTGGELNQLEVIAFAGAAVQITRYQHGWLTGRT